MTEVAKGFGGLRVVAFESRLAAECASLIGRQGGRATVAPSMREVPLGDNPAIAAFAEVLLAGRLEVVIFLTGVGARQLIEATGTSYPKDKLLESLGKTIVVARGPKPVKVLTELGVPIAYRVPEPNTWRELLELLDEHVPLDGRSVAVQEYGISNPSLLAGLEARGARLLRVPVYRWDLPEDTRPLEQAVRAVAAAEADVLLFTNRAQVDHVVQMAGKLGLEPQFRQAVERMVVCSIGPTASEALWYHGLPVDVVPEHPKLGHLVQEAARRAGGLLEKKRALVCSREPVRSRESRVESREPASGREWRVESGERRAETGKAVGKAHPTVSGSRLSTLDSRLLKACRREPTDTTPIWIMRQAGRYLPEYRAIREKVSFLELCKTPELAAEVTLQPVRRLGVDAAIIFADILPLLEPMGVDLEYAKGEGPVIHNPIRESSDVDRLIELESAEALGFVFEAIRLARAALDPATPLIGFAGAPFTLASYAIEGGSSRHFEHTKVLMYRDPGAWRALMERLARGLVQYLRGQIAAGVQAVQLFDSWVGCLGPEDYRAYVLPYTRQVVEGIMGVGGERRAEGGGPAMGYGLQATAGTGYGLRATGYGGDVQSENPEACSLKPEAHSVPIIHFATGNPALLPLMKEAGGDVMGLDWRVDLGEAWHRLGYDVAVQGNLDPLALFAEPAEIRRRAASILKSAAGRPGHIFNLGHGILPQTPVDHAVALVDAVHEMGRN